MNLIGKQLVALLLIIGLAPLVSADVLVSIDRGSLTVDDTFVLSLKATAGEDLNNTNFGALNEDFDALQSHRESNFSIVNGQRESVRALHITLAPKHSGRLVIPALNVDGVQTRPITLMVKESRADLNAFDPVFVEAEVNHKQVYVQSQVLFTFRIYRAISLTDMAYSGLELSDVRIEPMESSNYVRNIDGQDYQVNELRFALFPQQSGSLEIPALEFTARQATQPRGFLDLSSRGKPLRRKSKPISVEVLPIPDEYPDAPWLPSSELLISEDWSAPPQQMAVGDSTTRTLTVKALGLTGAQLPPLENPSVDGIKIYADQPKAENINTETGISALGINSAAWVFTTDGEFDIPEVRIPWWDTDDNTLRYARVPSRHISVKAAPVPQSVSTAPATTPTLTSDLGVGHSVGVDASRWKWATWAALLGWFLTTLFLLRRRTPAVEKTTNLIPVPDSEATCFKSLLAACRKDDALLARASLLRWASALLPDLSNPSISQLQELVEDPSLAESMRELEKTLYATGAQPWQGQELADGLQAWRKVYLKARKNSEKSPLPPLYN